MCHNFPAWARILTHRTGVLGSSVRSLLGSVTGLLRAQPHACTQETAGLGAACMCLTGQNMFTWTVLA